MPAKGFLNLEQKAFLQKALKEEEHPDIRERILILLLLNDGKTQPQIADFIGCSVRKVAYWSVHGDPDNLDSLKDKRMEGNHKKATKEYVDLLLEIIDRDPAELGYDFGRWTTKRLATYLALKTGIKLSNSQVRRILAKKRMRPRVERKRTARALGCLSYRSEQADAREAHQAKVRLHLG